MTILKSFTLSVRMMSPPPTMQSTGDKEALSLVSRTKANVDHAGLSHLLALLKVTTLLLLDNSSHFLNNNSLIATCKTEAAMVAGWIKLSSTLMEAHSKMRAAIPTRLLVSAADTTEHRAELALQRFGPFPPETITLSNQL